MSKNWNIMVTEVEEKGLRQFKTSQGEQLFVCLLRLWTDDCWFGGGVALLPSWAKLNHWFNNKWINFGIIWCWNQNWGSITSQVFYFKLNIYPNNNHEHKESLQIQFLSAFSSVEVPTPYLRTLAISVAKRWSWIFIPVETPNLKTLVLQQTYFSSKADLTINPASSLGNMSVYCWGANSSTPYTPRYNPSLSIAEHFKTSI